MKIWQKANDPIQNTMTTENLSPQEIAEIARKEQDMVNKITMVNQGSTQVVPGGQPTPKTPIEQYRGVINDFSKEIMDAKGDPARIADIQKRYAGWFSPDAMQKRGLTQAYMDELAPSMRAAANSVTMARTGSNAVQDGGPAPANMTNASRASLPSSQLPV